MTTTLLEKPPTRKHKRSARSLQREIRNRLNLIDDTDALHAILRLVIKREPEMPEELVRRLEASDRSIAEGRTIPHEEVMEHFRQRFKEYDCQKISDECNVIR